MVPIAMVLPAIDKVLERKKAMADEVVQIILKCEKGHKQHLTIIGMGIEYAKDYAGLLDGTSRFFMRPIDKTLPPSQTPHSHIGKCGVCGAWITATVEET